MKNKLFFFLFIVLFSCKSSKDKEDLELDMNKVKIEVLPEKSFDFFNIVKDFQLIQLETVSDGLIGNIHKVIIVNDKIFILDRLMAKSVFCFDINGKFIRKIGNHGRGPGEWLNPLDIAYLEDSQYFVIYCHSSRKLIFYDLNGNYIKEINSGLSFKSFEFINKDTIIAFTHGVLNIHQDYGELPFDLLSFNTDVEILSTQFFNNTEINFGKVVATFPKYFSKSEKGFFLNWLFNDTIYLIQNNELTAKPFLYVDFGIKRLKEQHLSELGEIVNRISKGDNHAIIKPVHVLNNLLLIEFAAGINNDVLKSYRILYDLESSNYLFFEDLTYSDNFKWENPIGVTNNFFINSIYPHEFNSKNVDFLEGIEHRSDFENENPILVLYKFKDLEDW